MAHVLEAVRQPVRPGGLSVTGVANSVAFVGLVDSAWWLNRPKVHRNRLALLSSRKFFTLAPSPEAFLTWFRDKAKATAVSNEIEVLDATIREWRSEDDPNWRQSVLYVMVRSDAERALQLWDKLSALLREELESRGPVFAAALEEKVSISVKWTGDAHV